MNRKYCYGTDCDEDRCRCHDSEIELEIAIGEYNKSVADLKVALEMVAISNELKLKVITDTNKFLTEMINRCK